METFVMIFIGYIINVGRLYTHYDKRVLLRNTDEAI